MRPPALLHVWARARPSRVRRWHKPPRVLHSRKPLSRPKDTPCRPVRSHHRGRAHAAQSHHDGAAHPHPRPQRAAACRRRSPANITPMRAGAGLIMSEATSVEAMGRRLSQHARQSGRTSRPKAGSRSCKRCMPRAAASSSSSGMSDASQIRIPGWAPAGLGQRRCPRRATFPCCRPPKEFGVPRASTPPRSPASSRRIARAPRTPRPPASTDVEIPRRPTAICSTSSCRTVPTGAQRRLWRQSVRSAARLMLEVADACWRVVGRPIVSRCTWRRAGDSHTMGDSDLTGTFLYVARELASAARLPLCAPRAPGARQQSRPQLREAFAASMSPYEGFTKESGEAGARLRRGRRHRLWQALHLQPRPRRALPVANAPLNAWNLKTFYTPGPVGYTDYPALETAAAT